MNNIYIPTESQEQIALFQWAALQKGKYPELELLYHVPNGGVRHATTAKRLKAEGVKAGVPDLCLPVPREDYHGLYIEMKRLKKSAESESQKQWLAALSAQGYWTQTCKGWEDAKDTIIKYLKLEQYNEKYTLVVCPYCRYVYKNAFDFENGPVYECEACKGAFTVREHFEILYSTKRVSGRK